MRRCAVLAKQSPLVSLVTHDVTNQVPYLEQFNVFATNRRLAESIGHYSKGALSEADLGELNRYGKVVGSAEMMEHARLCNVHVPEWTPFDRQGRRIDTATFHPSYHKVIGAGVEHGVPSSAYSSRKWPQMFRFGLSSMHYSLEQGTGCPLTMTFAAVPVLSRNNECGVFEEWIKKLTTPAYDGRDVHISQKSGVLCGMSMTEKQGGSDVRANTTSAVPRDPAAPVKNGAEYLLTGHKWFTSAPMCDAFLTLAQTPEGLSCFLVPRWLEDGVRNTGLGFMRLKSKLGDRSNASSEVEYRNAVGYLVGKPGKGVRNIIEMVGLTRLDCMSGSASLMQSALVHAVHHASHRKAFGQVLVETPLMRNVLCDLALESEAATALAARITNAFDRKDENSFRRIAVAIGKYYVCKTAPQFVYECLECHGGNGYVEDFPLARFYRQAPLNAVWEGSGNVIVLDVFRALAREPEALSALKKEIDETLEPAERESFAALIGQLVSEFKSDPNGAVIKGRVFVEKLALYLQAAALSRVGPKSIADAFIEERLRRAPRRNYGTLAPGSVLPELIERQSPVMA